MQITKFFCILERVDGINEEISKLILDRKAYRSRQCADNYSALVKAAENKVAYVADVERGMVMQAKNKANPTTDEVRLENQAAVLNQSQCSSP